MYRHILVTLDGSAMSESVLPHVEAIARSCRPGGKITLLQVVPPLHIFQGLERSLPPHEQEQLEKDATAHVREYLKDTAARLHTDTVPVATEVLHGEVEKRIVDYAHQHDVDLIMIGTHGHSEFRRLIIGSVAEKVAHGACIPVFLVRPPECRVKL